MEFRISSSTPPLFPISKFLVAKKTFLYFKKNNCSSIDLRSKHRKKLNFPFIQNSTYQNFYVTTLLFLSFKKKIKIRADFRVKVEIPGKTQKNLGDGQQKMFQKSIKNQFKFLINSENKVFN